jgi:SAM-dependent methyltransferase
LCTSGSGGQSPSPREQTQKPPFSNEIGGFCVCSPTAGTVIDLYQRHAGAWARDRGDDLIEKAWLDRFLALLPHDPTVLDLGCGCGAPIARYLIEHGCRVTGVDAASAMITMCAERFPEAEWLFGDMRTLALNRTFNGIIAWDSFFHLSQADQRPMFAIFKRHAASGAALMFTSGPSAGEAVGSYRGEPLYHASLDGAEYRALLHEAGFDVVAQVNEDPTCGLRTIWLAQAAV